jgi:hypothetical protein
MTESIDLRRIRRHRLTAQLLVGAREATPADAVRRLLALQGQDLAGARWSVGVRAARATEAGVDAAFAEGRIVRSWPLRGTLHVVAAEDLGWLLALTSGRTLASAAARRAALGITAADIERADGIAHDVLAGGHALGRRDLLGAFEAGGVSVEGQRGYHLLWHLAQAGTLLLGPPVGREQGFALVSEWVPGPRRLERDEALGELVARYVGGHGPATVADVARWAGLTLADVRRGVAVAGQAITSLTLAGTDHLVAPGLLDAPPARRDEAGRDEAGRDGAGRDGAVHLLAGFDEYVLGYGDRSAMLAPSHADLVVPGGNGMFKPTVLVDGEVVGTWKRTIRAREVLLQPTLFPGAAAPDPADLAAAAERYGSFLGRPVRLA